MSKAYKRTYLKSTYFICIIALLSALSVVMHLLLKFNLPPFPTFLQIHFSDIPALIAAIFLGPLPAAAIVLIKVIIKSIVMPDFVPFVGDIADLIIGLALVLPAGFLHKKKNKQNLLLTLIISGACSIIAAIIINVTFIVPMYLSVGGMPLDALIGMCKVMIPSINSSNFYTVYGLGIILPFNLVKNIVIVFVVWILSKRLKLSDKKLYR